MSDNMLHSRRVNYKLLLACFTTCICYSSAGPGTSKELEVILGRQWLSGTASGVIKDGWWFRFQLRQVTTSRLLMKTAIVFLQYMTNPQSSSANGLSHVGHHHIGTAHKQYFN